MSIANNQEKLYHSAVTNYVLKPGGHIEHPLPADFIQHNGKRLYTVTTVASAPSFGGTRTIVVCDTLDVAKRIVENNDGDIWEYSYMLVVIEAIACNWLYYPLLDDQHWYVWNVKEARKLRTNVHKCDSDDNAEGSCPHCKAYVPIEMPKEYQSIVGFGVG